MVQVISKTKTHTHTTLKLTNSLASSMFDITNSKNKNSLINKKNLDIKSYIEYIKEKKEIDKIKSDFKLGKFLTLKEFLLEN